MPLSRGGGSLGLPTVILVALCALSFGIMEWLALNQWLSGRWFLADVGNIQYCLVNTWTGKFMYSHLEQGNFFAFHFSPFLLLLLPLVWLSDYPIPLVTVYQLALALTPIPIYILSRQRGLSLWIGVAIGFWFVCNHFVGSLQLSNHFESLFVLFTLCAMAAMQSRVRFAWMAFAVAAISVKEDCALWLLGFALWAWVFHRTDPLVRSRAVRLAAVCVGWLGLSVVVLWWLGQGAESNASRYIGRMGGLSLGRDNVMVWLTLAASSGLICLLNWRAALLLLVPLPVILGNFEFTRNLLYYYSYPFLPFLAFATVAGAAQLQHWTISKWRPVLIPVLCLCFAVLGAVQFGSPTRVEDFRRTPFPVTDYDRMRHYVMNEVLPRDVPVALQFGLWGVTPWRADTVLLKPGQIKDHHYLAIDQVGVHGLAPDEYTELQDLLENDLLTGRRKMLPDTYEFVILTPVIDDNTTGALAVR